MPQTIRISKPGFNVLTDPDIFNYSLFADSDNILIKEFARGTGQLDLHEEIEITHGLGYIPSYLVYGEVDTNKFRATNWYSLFSGVWRAYATTSELIIRNEFNNSFKNFRYYIFHDEVF